ncbi:MAG: hypothetical protein ACKO23_12080 [Gemmataceae bacterium]
MKRMLFAAVMALGLLAGSQTQAKAGSFGFGIGIGVNFSAWSNCGGNNCGTGCGPAGCGYMPGPAFMVPVMPPYGYYAPMGPAMYPNYFGY